MATKVAIIYNSVNAESLLCYAMAQAASVGDTIEVINIVSMASGDIDTAISELTSDQDIIYVPLTIATDISQGQYDAAEAKLVADTGVIYNYPATNRAAVRSMADKCWRQFNPVSMPPTCIAYMSDLITNITADELLTGAYLALSIVARYNTIDDGDIIFNDLLLKELTDLMDKGIYDERINAASKGLPAPVQDKLILHDLEIEGQAIYDYAAIQAILNA